MARLDDYNRRIKHIQSVRKMRVLAEPGNNFARGAGVLLKLTPGTNSTVVTGSTHSPVASGASTFHPLGVSNENYDASALALAQCRDIEILTGAAFLFTNATSDAINDGHIGQYCTFTNPDTVRNGATSLSGSSHRAGKVEDVTSDGVYVLIDALTMVSGTGQTLP